MERLRILVTPALFLGIYLATNVAETGAATPTAEQALKHVPLQKSVDFDLPAPQEIAKCKITAHKLGGQVGWIVNDPQEKTLRRFLDTNGDNLVDCWCYYNEGIEVYRDIDANFNGKADQYRWFNTGGTRWGIDANEDGAIDSWKCISAEEATAEIVAALATRDYDRFARVALTADELQTLGLGKAKADELAEKLAKLKADFQQIAEKQKSVGPQTAWEQFSGNKPGAVPAGTEESTKDLRVYENVTAIVQTAGKHAQVQIGTLIQVGDCWKAIGAPREAGDGPSDAVAGGFFFQSPNRGESGGAGGGDEMQKLLAELEEHDKTSAQAKTPERQAAYLEKRAELLEKIAAAAKNGEDRAMWLRQLTDMIGAAVQMGQLRDGAERLEKLFDSLQKNNADKTLAAYVKFRQMMAANALAWQAPKADGAKIQTEWLKSLEGFLKEYPAAPDAAEAMLQLAFADEFSGQEEEAIKWYGRIEKEFADSTAAQKAIGARLRLESEGKPIKFAARSLSGKPLNLSASEFRGKAVLLQYWATWSDAARRDMPVLKELMAKYGKNFVVVSVSLDNDRVEVEKYLAENKLPWPQVFEPGGLDSPPANQLGILTVPTLILIDPQGKVLSKNIQAIEVEAALKKILR
ncbi:MAG: redoxin domain-containing protein [Pirellulales bacterium]|nr:redoxin domain-containing protein [Pirellulales bacterium]